MVDAEGYQEAKGKKITKKLGFNVDKHKPKFEYGPVGVKPMAGASSHHASTSKYEVKLSKTFDVLQG